MTFEFSTDNIIKIPYQVDYYNFDKLLQKDSWTLSEITESLYYSIWKIIIYVLKIMQSRDFLRA